MIANAYEKLKVWNGLEDKTDHGWTNQSFDKRFWHLKNVSNIFSHSFLIYFRFKDQTKEILPAIKILTI